MPVVYRNIQDHRHLFQVEYRDDRWPEWSVLAFLAAYFTVAQDAFPRYVEEMIQKLRDRNQTVIPDIASFTTEATVEAMASDEPTCYACMFDFSPEFSDEELKEPAVKSACGHFHGSVCLAHWVNDRNRGCPKCRQDLFSEESLFPPLALKYLRKTCHYLEKAQTFDEEIDLILSKDFELIHDESFGKLLHRLNKTATSFSRALCNLEFEVYAGQSAHHPNQGW
ncbi:hypothetical protein K491DRAFT_691065 [Lophiostoma macrostomum CBS 122681]|uniref:RING-type domain-containing protein n=1 Tax=Lophiostoma macrostomum CBS 122681 TaxID=1314788 RepID=A0A6A6TDM5_9PLEO|nr:hypothetical protein K491DRAFT_691065 [Lophiostoma macrostomum CBS 122681]